MTGAPLILRPLLLVQETVPLSTLRTGSITARSETERAVEAAVEEVARADPDEAEESARGAAACLLTSLANAEMRLFISTACQSPGCGTVSSVLSLTHTRTSPLWPIRVMQCAQTSHQMGRQGREL